jgi:hypothetical protein
MNPTHRLLELIFSSKVCYNHSGLKNKKRHNRLNNPLNKRNNSLKLRKLSHQKRRKKRNRNNQPNNPRLKLKPENKWKLNSRYSLINISNKPIPTRISSECFLKSTRQ